MKYRARLLLFASFALLVAFLEGACADSFRGAAPDSNTKPDASADIPADAGHDTDAIARPGPSRPDSSPSSPDGEAGRSEDLGATIGDVTVSGPLCPPESLAMIRSNDKHALTVSFSTAFGGDDAPGSTSCTISVAMDVPAGYRMGPLRIKWLGDAIRTHVARSYAYEGDEASSNVGTEISDESFYFDDRPELESPKCPATSRVRFVARVEATVHDKEAAFFPETFEIETGWRHGAVWQRGCDGISTVQAEPAGAGDWCGGPHGRPCTAGLGCEYDLKAMTDSEGLCVDPKEIAAPSGVQEPCGGLRHIACREGLICWRLNQAAIDHEWLGFCAEPEGALGTPCELGVPPLPCKSPLHCATSMGHWCVEANGELGSLCAPELPACASGLFCNGSRCAVPKNGPRNQP